MRVASVARRLPELTWVQLSLLAGGVLVVLWRNVPAGSTMLARTLHDLAIYVGGPGLLGLAYRRRIGWRVDRLAVRNTLLLTAFVVPFYLVGSTLPTVRSYYPAWSTSTALGEFVPHAVMLFLMALATETYYRGLLCVGVREIGRAAIFISPVVYALNHFGKPPIEVVLSGPTDVLFGFVDYESNSILPSVVAHGCGLVFLDWLVLHDPVLPPERVVEWLSWLPVPL